MARPVRFAPKPKARAARPFAAGKPSGPKFQAAATDFNFGANVGSGSSNGGTPYSGER